MTSGSSLQCFIQTLACLSAGDKTTKLGHKNGEKDKKGRSTIKHVCYADLLQPPPTRFHLADFQFIWVQCNSAPGLKPLLHFSITTVIGLLWL